jgi:hypothetical protein
MKNSRFKDGKLANQANLRLHFMRVILEVKFNVCLLILPTYKNIKLYGKALKIQFKKHFYKSILIAAPSD